MQNGVRGASQKHSRHCALQGIYKHRRRIMPTRGKRTAAPCEVNPRQRYCYVLQDRFGTTFAGFPLRKLIEDVADRSASYGQRVRLNQVRAFEKARLSDQNGAPSVYHGFRLWRAPLKSFDWSALPVGTHIVGGGKGNDDDNDCTESVVVEAGTLHESCHLQPTLCETRVLDLLK